MYQENAVKKKRHIDLLLTGEEGKKITCSYQKRP